MKKNTILIADSGSTKTDWVAGSSFADIVRFQSAGINPFYQSAEEIIPVLKNEVLPHLPPGIENIFFYGAGCADEVSGRPVKEALLQSVAFSGTAEIASDMMGAARALCGLEPGIACILGTGANNAFYDGEKIVRSIGSLGFWLGDEGSGSYLGKTLVVHFLQNEMPADLHQLFAQTYPEINRLYVLDNAYRKPYPNRYFAAFSEFIYHNIQHAFVDELVSSAFDLFIAKYICKHPETDRYPVHFTGSVAFYYQDILKIALEKKGLIAGKILKSPLEGLLEYHL